MEITEQEIDQLMFGIFNSLKDITYLTLEAL